MHHDVALLAQARFICLICGDVAGDVRVVKNESGIRFERWDTSFLVEPDKLGPHVWALHDNDVRALFALNLEYTPFYCPRCDASFCRKHWRIWQVFEEDGRVDCIRGTCPNGHTRMLED